jgi:hypothetical protein
MSMWHRFLLLHGAGAAAAAAAAAARQDVGRFNPSFNASSLTDHDPLPRPGEKTGWPVNPDNMPIGNGRMTALVWSDGSHANTSGIGLLLARDDAYTDLVQLIKLGRLRIQLSPDPFLGASVFNQTLDLATGEVLVSVTSGTGDLTVSLRVAATPREAQPAADGITVELLFSSKPVSISVQLELWRVDGPFPCVGGFSTNSVRGICNASSAVVHADTVETASSSGGAQLLWSYRNSNSTWKSTLENQLLWPDMPQDAPDPLINRQFGALVQGHGEDGSGAVAWVAEPPPCLPHCCADSSTLTCGTRTIQTSKPVTTARISIITHTNQTATAAEWLAQTQAIATAAAESFTLAGSASAHARRRATMAAFWNRSFVHVGGAPEAASVPIDPLEFTEYAGMIGSQPPVAVPCHAPVSGIR